MFTDCQSAIDIFTKLGKAQEKLEVFRVIWNSLRILKDRKIDLKLIWIPGHHADILGNELADRAAKTGADICTCFIWMGEGESPKEVGRNVV